MCLCACENQPNVNLFLYIMNIIIEDFYDQVCFPSRDSNQITGSGNIYSLDLSWKRNRKPWTCFCLNLNTNYWIFIIYKNKFTFGWFSQLYPSYHMYILACLEIYPDKVPVRLWNSHLYWQIRMVHIKFSYHDLKIVLLNDVTLRLWPYLTERTNQM
jgi:hypothetical protein